jgi:hypothetical protein
MSAHVTNINAFTKDVTLNVNIHIAKQFLFRIWVAKALIKLAAIVLGCGIKFEDNAGEEL